VLFALVLLQLLVMPDILIVENYKTMRLLDLVDTIPAIALPYIASGFGIFLLRQTFMTVPKELDEAARVEGASFWGSCGRSISRSPSRPILPMASFRSVITGTISSGR
jgi:sn-glycerol 3-phosphate transport system permease protein